MNTKQNADTIPIRNIAISALIVVSASVCSILAVTAQAPSWLTLALVALGLLFGIFTVAGFLIWRAEQRGQPL